MSEAKEFKKGNGEKPEEQETEEGEGTCFTITFTGKEKPSCTM